MMFNKKLLWLFWVIVSFQIIFFAESISIANETSIELGSLETRLSMESEAKTVEESESLWDKDGIFDGADTDLRGAEAGATWNFGLNVWNRFAVDTEDDGALESDLYNHARGVASVEYRHSDRLHAKAAVQGDYFFYRYDKGWENDDDVRVHDAYVNFSGPGYNARIGNQIVRWGKTDGISPLDNINPEDYRDGIAGRKENRKIPVPMVNIQAYRGAFAVQGVYIPFFEKSEFDIVGTDWALFDRVQERIGPFEWDSQSYSESIRDSQGGLRLAVTVQGLDFALSYLNKIHDLPSIDSLKTPPDFSLESDSLRDLPQFAKITGQPIRLRYDRTSVLGLELETTLGDVVLRGDLAYKSNVGFLTEKLQRIEKPVLEYVAGFDYVGPNNSYVNFQFARSTILEWDHAIAFAKETANSVTGTLSKEFDNGNFKLEIRFYQDLEGDANMFNPNLKAYHWQNATIEIGAEFFDGEAWTMLGTFKDNDQVYSVFDMVF